MPGPLQVDEVGLVAPGPGEEVPHPKVRVLNLTAANRTAPHTKWNSGPGLLPERVVVMRPETVTHGPWQSWGVVGDRHVTSTR